MKFAVISDLHLGADNCVLFTNPQNNAQIPEPLPPMVQLEDALRNNSDGGRLDYLVLLGDVFDLSLTSFDRAWLIAKLFFEKIDAMNITDKIIYVPGNHDFMMWHYFEQDINTTNRIREGRMPIGFNFSVPGYALLPNATRFILDGVTPGSYEGGIFSSLWHGDNKEFLVAYPNLYLVKDGVATVITHGQYFDLAWRVLSYLGLECADDFLDNEVAGEYTMKEFIGMNYPFSILDSSAIGQSGIFSALAQKVVLDTSNGDYSKLEIFLNRLKPALDKLNNYKGFWKYALESGSDIVIAGIVKELKGALSLAKHAKPSRYNADFVRENAEAIIDFLKITQRELRAIFQGSFEIDTLLFGHTHVASKNAGDQRIRISSNSQLSTLCMNTGGWVADKNGNFDGAIAFFDTNLGWKMVNADQITVYPAFPFGVK